VSSVEVPPHSYQAPISAFSPPQLLHVLQEFAKNLNSHSCNNRSRISRVAIDAPVAQLDRASAFEAERREFESLRARHFQRQCDFKLRLIPSFCFEQELNVAVAKKSR
jgi:hypothetical protein